MTTEIKVSIPVNDYMQPQEVREEVVQAICTAFLRTESGWRTFHPYCYGYGRSANIYIDIKRPYFNCPSPKSENVRRIHGCEMQAAFSALRKAGYHMFSTYTHGGWLGYTCEKKPHVHGCVEVDSFTDFID
jgi:hypothetical protein